MSDDGDTIEMEENNSDDGSDPASLGSRISDDSGIEDWSDEMTVQTDKEENAACTLDEKSNSSKQNPNSPLKDEVNTVDCIFPMLPDAYVTNTGLVRKDIPDDNGIKGVCGLNNLGNTCFMNAALQCLLATPTLRDLVSEGDILQNGSDHMHEPSAVLLFVERFQEVFNKVLSGKFSLLHPDQLHASVARLHPALGDYKEHDSQEFLSFLLNILHDLLNLASSRKISINDNSSSKNDSLISLTADDYSDDITCEVSKRLKMETPYENNVAMEAETDAGVECEENISKAEQSWRAYTYKNQSVIADSFQGQFQSIITCEKCACLSTTFEPFMFLSLPIPHAMEKQIVITWVPSPKMCTLPGMISVKRFLTTVNKNGCIGDVRKEFMTVLKKEDTYVNFNDIVLAEVNYSANIKLLDDRTQLSYLSKTKNVYALEVISVKNTSDDKFDTESNNEEATQETNILSGFETLSESGASENDERGYMKVSNDDIECTESVVETASAWHSCSICLEETFDEELKVHSVCGGLLCRDCLNSTSEFHNHQKFPCPICNGYISTEDYKPLLEPKKDRKGKKNNRQLLVPVMFRHDTKDKTSTSRKFELFGHPVLCSLLSQIDSEYVLELVNQVLQSLSQLSLHFDVIITDGAGLSCGICDMFSSCTGCNVKDIDNLQLKPGCCITVYFHDNVNTVAQMMSVHQDDKSLASLRTSDVVTLDECIETFADREILTEDNPWYCPQCQTNQASSKTMTVTRWPDILIVHLKRFYFEGSQACKITCPVDFPLSDLNVDVLACADENEALKTSNQYSLYGCICHTGTLFGGHYTAFTKAAMTSDWYYFNDESFQKLTPSEEHQTEGYVLFYQRKGTSK